jgi:glycogen operon protein
VDRLHQAGIEVILDVVYNHSCEGNELGPTLSLRGIDNLSYYRLQPDNLRYYINDTGCGNTLNTNHPQVRALVLDSLRYWAEHMGVDGFRFDLATVLGREQHGFNAGAPLFAAMQQDPVLSQCKLIAEPWDLGPGGYQLGGFPPSWAEWNDRYRDTARRFWRGDPGQLQDLAARLHGSSDVFRPPRGPHSSINYVCSHDGFTLRDLVSYEQRHNLANGENNADGHRGNHSSNHGCEGPSARPEINAARWQSQRNFIALLYFSQGVPMLLAGDEFGRTQHGNNNAYCQDNPINWLDWQAAEDQPEARALLEFTRTVVALRSRIRLLRAEHYTESDQAQAPERPHMLWYNTAGEPMQAAQWEDPHQHCLVCAVLGGEQQSPDSAASEHLLLLLNADHRAHDFRIPERTADAPPLFCHLDTARGIACLDQARPVSGRTRVAARSLQLLLSPAALHGKALPDVGEAPALHTNNTDSHHE